MPRSRIATSLTALATAVALVVALGGTPAQSHVRPAFNAAATARVIVQGTTLVAAQAAVTAAGGRVGTSLPIVTGVSAEVPTAALAALRTNPDVRAVTPDADMHVQGAIRTGSRPPSVYGPVVRSTDLNAAGYAGAGVTVAVLDTGINPSADLAGRILPVVGLLGRTGPCVNLSGEPTCADGYGHGTFLAGIIAGDGASSNGRYVGAAPKANLVSIKVASNDGSADVSTVLAGIQWAVSYRDRYNIRVLNLSLGTDSTQSWLVDPLNLAVERAWKAGIVVVVSASNRGPDGATISKPGDDPYVITVGASDDTGTVPLTDDVIPDFSGRGPTADGLAKPDVVAPGGHIVSLRAVGSTIDTEFPNYIDGTYRQGSGTSMSAAVVSGSVADILSAQPSWVPNRIKFALMATARPDGIADPMAVGRGLIDAYSAALAAPRGLANGGLASSSGTGSLDLSRGSVSVMLDDPVHTVLSGLLTAQLLLWQLDDLLGPWSELSWQLSVYNLLPWFATLWHGELWKGHNWEGCSWSGGHEETCSYGHNWEGSTWYGAWD